MTASVTPIDTHYARNGHVWRRTSGINMVVMMGPREILNRYEVLDKLMRDYPQEQKYKDFKLSLDKAVNEAAIQREIG